MAVAGSVRRLPLASPAPSVFGLGEGLPGQAWSQGRPIVLRQFEGSASKRTEAAQAVGLTCAIAMPLPAGNDLKVVVMFCGDDAAHASAIKLSRNDPAQSPDMALVDTHCGTTAKALVYIARHVNVRRGSGLPGIVWATGMPVFIDD